MNFVEKKSFTIPLVLTYIRLLVSPLILPLFLVYLLPYNILYINSILAILFIFFGLTDFFDGYFARRYNQVTMLGKLLDPVADKCLVYATLVSLVAVHKIFFYWAILIIGREFFVMGLRLVATESSKDVSVMLLGKIKTVVHIACLSWLILNPYQSLGYSGAFWWNGIEALLIFLSLVLSLFSGGLYYKRFMQQLA